jgi:hypothetical protein
MKFLITIAIIYFAYRLLFAAPRLNGQGGGQQPPSNPNRRRDDDDYIDYEELK